MERIEGDQAYNGYIQKKYPGYKQIVISGDILNSFEKLEECNRNGEKALIAFQDRYIVLSDEDLDKAAQEILGKTREEHRAELEDYENKREIREKTEKEAEAKRKVENEKKIPQWIERGKKLVTADKQEEWEKYVKESVQSGGFGRDIEDILNIMESVASGANREEVKNLISEQSHSGSSYSLYRSIIKEFFGHDIAGIEAGIVDMEDIRKELMSEFKLSQDKKNAIAEKDKAIEGLKELEHKYEKEIDKTEGKVF